MGLKIFSMLLVMTILLAGCEDKSVQTTKGNGESPQVAGQSASPNTPPSVDIEQPSSVRRVWPTLKLAEAYPKLSFNRPLEYLHAADESNRVFVVEKSGRVRVFDNDVNAAYSDVFLDIRDKVESTSSEKGLLGMAFHPDFRDNGFFYVNYTNRSHTVIARYRVNPDNPVKAMPGSEQVILTIRQPFSNHNGGHMEFGPDGYLYIGTGDGGSTGDPYGNAQNLSSLLGKILRIDVDKTQPGLMYGIPADNPLVENQSGYRKEIYAYGFRNPWKFSFDPKDGRLWVADVGQDSMEEIDVVEKGMNYGWNIMEGSLCYPESKKCAQNGLILPLWEYGHTVGKSITGGYVYRGAQAPGIDGVYVYGDYVSGRIWGFRADGALSPKNKLLIDSNLRIASFGVDRSGELYVLDFGGKIYRLQFK